MLERNGGEVGDQMLLERPRSDPASVNGTGKSRGPAPNETLRLRSPARQEPPLADRASPQLPSEADDERGAQDRDDGDEIRESWFRRHPIAFALGLLCVPPAISATCWFEDTGTASDWPNSQLGEGYETEMHHVQPAAYAATGRRAGLAKESARRLERDLCLSCRSLHRRG